MKLWLKSTWIRLVQHGIDFCETRMHKAADREDIGREMLWDKIGHWLLEKA